MNTDKLFTLDEARDFLAAKGFERSRVWIKTMVRVGKIKEAPEKMYGRTVIELAELRRVLKKKPKLQVIIKALAFFLLFGSTLCNASPSWTGIAIHHTDSNHMTLAECNTWHRARGWDSCGYNFIIEPDGQLIESRGFNQIGAHARGMNSRFLGVALVGRDSITSAQLETLARFIHLARLKYGIQVVKGHRDIGHTLCPGEAIWNRVKGIL